jgi:CubicO group peptidase (beta-lactamase class C family)
VNGPTPVDGKPVLDSYFWAGAYSTNFWVDPKRDIIGLVMTQVVPITQTAEQLLHRAVNEAVEN